MRVSVGEPIMPGPDIPSATDAANAAGSLVDKAKGLIDVGKKIGGALSGLNAAKDDAGKIGGALADENLTPAQKALTVVQTVYDRLPGANAGQLVDPNNPDSGQGAGPLGDGSSAVRVSVVTVYVDP